MQFRTIKENVVDKRYRAQEHIIGFVIPGLPVISYWVVLKSQMESYTTPSLAFRPTSLHSKPDSP